MTFYHVRHFEKYLWNLTLRWCSNVSVISCHVENLSSAQSDVKLWNVHSDLSKNSEGVGDKSPKIALKHGFKKWGLWDFRASGVDHPIPPCRSLVSDGSTEWTGPHSVPRGWIPLFWNHPHLTDPPHTLFNKVPTPPSSSDFFKVISLIFDIIIQIFPKFFGFGFVLFFNFVLSFIHLCLVFFGWNFVLICLMPT